MVAVEPTSGDQAGERVNFEFDATGRLISRTEWGDIPEGGGESDRPFVAKREFVWDGQRLAAETGLNFQDEPTWRYQYTPGPGGLDDAPLVRVERGLQGTPTTGTYALLRDEMGSVIGVAEEHAGQQPTLLARYLQTPYGKRHVELGPELVKTEYDEAVVSVGGQDQAATPGETVEGALRIVTTLPLAASSLESGLLIEHYDDASSSWQTSDTEELAIGTDSEDPTNLLVMRLAGWAKATRYRVTPYSGPHRRLRPPDRTA